MMTMQIIMTVDRDNDVNNGDVNDDIDDGDIDNGGGLDYDDNLLQFVYTLSQKITFWFGLNKAKMVWVK